MESKKSPNANLEKNRIPLMVTGLVVALSLSLFVLEWGKSPEKERERDLSADLIEEEIAPISIQAPPPPPPPPPPAPTTVIEIVEDEEEIEDEIEFEDMDVDEDTEVEEIEEVVEEAESDEIFMMVEQMPSLPGCEGLSANDLDECNYIKISKFLGQNINYPEMAKEAGLQGRVYVKFVIEKNGKVSNVELLRGIGGGCDEEALRVVKKLPKWNPGKQRGKPARVSYKMPIVFKLR